MTIDEILKFGFVMEKNEEWIGYRLDLENHPILKGLHLVIDVRYDMVLAYCKDLDFDSEFRFYECFLNEKNLTELLKYLKHEL